MLETNWRAMPMAVIESSISEHTFGDGTDAACELKRRYRELENALKGIAETTTDPKTQKTARAAVATIGGPHDDR